MKCFDCTDKKGNLRLIFGDWSFISTLKDSVKKDSTQSLLTISNEHESA